MSIIEKIMQAVEDTVVEAEVDFPAGREAGPCIEYDSDELRQKIEAILSLTTKETFSGTVDTDTPLMAAAREAGWALMEVVDEIAWEKREQVSDIIGQLGVALSESDAGPAATTMVAVAAVTASQREAFAKALFWELENHDRCPSEARGAIRRHSTVRLIMQRLEEACAPAEANHE